MNQQVPQTNITLSHSQSYSQNPEKIIYQNQVNQTNQTNQINSTQNKKRKNLKNKHLINVQNKNNQEKNNIILNEIRDKIDENHLGITKDIQFRGARGALYSYYKSYFLTHQQVIDEMNTIESYLPTDNKEHLLKKLEEKHWYVNYLLQRSRYIKNKQPRFIEVQSDRWKKTINGKMQPFALTQIVDTISEKLYNHDLTENEIDHLVQQGADINYKGPQYNGMVPDGLVALFFAHSKTEQGVKNMQKIIALGAELHNTGEWHTPLTIAVQENYSPMIQLLLPYEKAEISTDLEWKRREYLISNSFSQQNFESIKSLLKLNLITVNQGLTEFIGYGKPHEEILKLFN